MKKQMGMTMLSWVVVLAFVGFQLMLVVKIAPIFAENHTIKTIWKGLEYDTSLIGAAPKEIKKNIMKEMKMNSVYGFDVNTIKIKKSRGGYIVSIKYEPRGNIIGPIDYIATFNHEAMIKTRAN